MAAIHKICRITSDTKNLFEICIDLLRECGEDMKNIFIILTIMLVITTSTATAERVFSKLNIPVTKVNSRPILKQWIKIGKRHIRGHKTKNKEHLTELTTSGEMFFIDLTS